MSPGVSRRAGWPMYVADRPAVQTWWRGLADGLRQRGVAGVPDALAEPDDGAAALEAHWLDPRLLLSQTCGYPLVTRLAGAVQVVGALRWTAAGCDGIGYRSWLVARGDGDRDGDGGVAPPVDASSQIDAALAADAVRAIEPFRGGVAAISDAGSHSGCNVLRALVAPLSRGAGRPFFSGAVETGSHRASLAAVRDGRAHIAAIDCIVWAGLQRTAPALLDGLRVVGSSAPAPGLPLITSAATAPADLAALRSALAAACTDAALADARAALFIGGFEVAEAAQWDAVDAMRRSALATGCDFPRLDGRRCPR